MKMLLALDPAARCGYALFMAFPNVPPRRIVSGTYKVPGRDLESRIPAFHQWLAHNIKAQEVTHLAYEEPHIRYAKAARSGHSMQASIWIACSQAGVTYVGGSPAEIKRHATGKGTASKQEMMKAAAARWSHKPCDDNEADALCVGDWALESFEW